MKFDLLTVFTDGTKKVIKDVDVYEILANDLNFIYVKKNGFKIFVNPHEVRYIGNLSDLEDCEG